MNVFKSRFFYPFLLTVIFIGAYAYTFDAKVAQLGDNASYYMLGKSISEGRGYVNISNVKLTPNNHYPPGYPAFLAAGMLFTSEFTGLKLLNGLCLLVSVLLLYLTGIKLTGSRVLSFIISLGVVLNYHLLQYGSMLMSEVPFLCFTLLTIYCLVSLNGSPSPLRSRFFWLALIFGIIAYYMRSLGIALIFAVVAFLAIQKNWKAALAYLTGFILAALPWFLRTQRLGGGSYGRQLQMINPYRPELGKADTGDYVNRIFENFSRYISTEIPYSLFPSEIPDYRASPETGSWLFGLLLAGIILFGFWQMKSFRLFILMYVLFTFGILMIWPDVWVGPRFMLPLIPFLYLGLFYGLYVLVSRITALANKTIHPGWLGILLLFLLPAVNQLNSEAKIPLHPAWKNYYAMGEWLRSNETRDVVVSCGKPALFHLYSGTYTSRYAFESDAATFIQALEDQQVDYVVLDQVYGNTYRYLLPAIQAYPERFNQVFYLENPQTYLFKFVK